MECITGENKRIHWIDPLACIDCAACGIVCPTEAILDSAGCPIPFMKKKGSRPIAVVDEIFCSGCDFCTDICPFDCLEIVKDRTQPLSNSVVKMVNEGNCVACRLCEDVCQKEAIAVVHPGRQSIQTRRATGCPRTRPLAKAPSRKSPPPSLRPLPGARVRLVAPQRPETMHEGPVWKRFYAFLLGPPWWPPSDWRSLP